MARAKGKIKVEDGVIHQTILPSSWLEYHPAMQWPLKVYAGDHMVTDDGTAKSQSLIPCVPLSWHKAR